MLKSWLLAPVLLVALFATRTANALTQTLEVDRDGRTAFHIESFGFEVGGHFSMQMSDFVLWYPHDATPGDTFKLALVLQRSDSDEPLLVEDNGPDHCFHENVLPDDLVIMLDPTKDPPGKELDINIPGFYHLYFSNCEKGAQVSYTLSLTEYNVDSSGNRVYLTAGEANLPTAFFIICLMFVCQAVAWLGYMKQQSKNVRTIHWLMTAVLMLKIASLFFESLKYHALKTTGHNNGWSIMYYIFNSVKGLLFFGVVLLIGTGWSYLKPFLTERDKLVMLVVLVVQAMANIAVIVLDETPMGSAGWVTWRDMMHLLDIVCCLVVLLPIVWSIRHLKASAGADGKAAANMKRLQAFRSFYLLVVMYVYFTRIIVILMTAMLSLEMTWMTSVFTEFAALIFYGATGWLFRPQTRNPYLALDKDDDDIDMTQLGEL